MKAHPAPRLEAFQATVFIEPRVFGYIRLAECTRTSEREALKMAYGDSGCILPEPGETQINIEEPSWALAEYLTDRWEERMLGESAAQRLGRMIFEVRPPLWETVRQLTFDFEERNLPAIRGFYHEYGPLGYPSRQQPTVDVGEPWGWCLAALRWFREVTVLFDSIEARRTMALWERFGEPRLVPVDPPETVDNVFLRRRPRYDPSDYTWRFDTPFTDEEGNNWVTPRDEAELYRAAFALLGQVVSLELQKIPLIPLNTSLTKRADPLCLWGFRPAGSFHAAFLQWFFEHLAGLGSVKCAAEGCDNLVLPPQKKYCSRQCEMRTRKAGYRERQAMAIRLHQDGMSVAAIGRAIQDKFCMKKPPKADSIMGWINKDDGGETP